MKLSRFVIAGMTTLFVTGCSPAEKPAEDSTVPAAAPPAATTLSQADVAGNWQMRSVPESGTDTTPTLYTLTATSDTSVWTITFANGQKVSVRATVSGDSIMQRSDTYTSVRRPGVKVWTEGVARIEGGRMVGRTVAHYQGAGKDSVLHLRTEGTRVP
jgi:hypothetical protein